MAAVVPTRQRLAFSSGSLKLSLDESVVDELHLAEGAEVEVRVESGRMIVEPVRPKLLEPASDVNARAERQRQVAAATEHAMQKHHDLLALLAK